MEILYSVSIAVSNSTCHVADRDGNGADSDLVESPCTQDRKPKSKPKTKTESLSG
jgi:hypothetical protein